ncbi:hypothetical protein [Vulcanococcus sp.]|uniref:hypothetical protein n=1 Tax=Vulcanococcus sp. TaxID=2856995 RepID=UPI003F6A3429
MQVDYSGYADVGRVQGQALANMGAQIGGIIKQRGEQKKQDAVDEKFLQQGSEFFQGTPLEQSFSDAYQNYTSEDITPREKRAIATSIRSLIPIGMEAQKMRMASVAEGDSLMRLTPEEADQYSQAGYALEIVGRNPDGSLIVRDMTRKGAGGTGGLVPFFNEQTGAFGMKQAPPTSFPPTPGATPRAVADPSIIQQAAQGFTPPMLPVGGGGASDALLPPRVVGGVEPPVATTATGAVPNADFFANGGTRAMQVPESMRDLEAQLKRQQIAKAKAETSKAEIEMTEAKEKEVKGRDSFSSYVGSIANAYAELDNAGAAISTRKGPMANIQSFAAGTELGKSVGAAVGSEAASFRAIIDSQTPGIINVIRQSSEMGAKGMDSDAERRFYITALGTQTLPVEANIRALIELDKAYGNGDVANIVKEKNPALYARSMSDKYIYKSGKKDETVGDEEVESILQGLGL